MFPRSSRPDAVDTAEVGPGGRHDHVGVHRATIEDLGSDLVLNPDQHLIFQSACVVSAALQSVVHEPDVAPLADRFVDGTQHCIDWTTAWRRLMQFSACLSIEKRDRGS
eukprot:scaffold48_cov311-Pinguiococcus_pyrenoidosus.AAC.75